MKNDRLVSYYFTVFVALMGFIVTFVIFSVEAIELGYFLKHAIQTDAKISSISKVDMDGGPAKVITVSYKVNNITYTTESKVISSLTRSKHFIGNDLSVLYVKDDPTNARINSFDEIYFSLITTGILWLLFSMLFLLARKNKEWIMNQGGGPWEYG